MRDIAQDALLAELRALRPELERTGVTHVALFGSRARRDNRPDSDIDLLIEVDESRKFSLIDLVGVAQRIEDRLGLPANLFMQRSLDPAFLAEARSEQIEVFG
jgi:predicted nucleotidyltransferase